MKPRRQRKARKGHRKTQHQTTDKQVQQIAARIGLRYER